jgi:hypothetical protein
MSEPQSTRVPAADHPGGGLHDGELLPRSADTGPAQGKEEGSGRSAC